MDASTFSDDARSEDANKRVHIMNVIYHLAMTHIKP